MLCLKCSSCAGSSLNHLSTILQKSAKKMRPFLQRRCQYKVTIFIDVRIGAQHTSILACLVM